MVQNAVLPQNNFTVTVPRRITDVVTTLWHSPHNTQSTDTGCIEGLIEGTVRASMHQTTLPQRL